MTMRTLKTHIHPDLKELESLSQFTRIATRAICLNQKDILLLFTERYDDFSLPGGGVDKDEDITKALKRELSEETGAQNISEIKPFGLYEEYRPWYKPDFDVQHMISYCFTCKVDKKLGATSYEDYETNNGMKPLWVDIDKAITHNKKTMAESSKKGLSIQRETFLLELIKKELVETV